MLMRPQKLRCNAFLQGALALSALALFLMGSTDTSARTWSFVGGASAIEAEYLGMRGEMVILQGTDGKPREYAWSSISPADQIYVRSRGQNTGAATPAPATNPAPLAIAGVNRQTFVSLPNRMATLSGALELHLTSASDPLPGSSINFTSQNAWLFLDNMLPSAVASTLLGRFKVNGAEASLNNNLRVAQYGSGTVLFPCGKDFPAMTVFNGKSFTGASMPLLSHVPYDDANLGTMKAAISSFRLKRGYMVTIAQNEDGTGVSKNYIAQDADLEVTALPAGLDRSVRFIRIFPWRWVSKKGIAGDIWQNFKVGWFYDWNISRNSPLDVDYVPIKQKKNWPGLNQDWKERGSTHLLAYNEPDHKEQANMTVDEAIAGWPALLGTGLRLGSPGVSDGGLKWLYEFIDKADAGGLRVDFVAVHYYRGYSKPGDAKGAAAQLYNFLKDIHERTKRPIWLTEFNNGANWTKEPKPTYEQEKAVIAEFIEMLDKTPFVERYAIYNWVEDVRNVQRKDGSLTPTGEAYRDKVSPPSYSDTRGAARPR